MSGARLTHPPLPCEGLAYKINSYYRSMQIPICTATSYKAESKLNTLFQLKLTRDRFFCHLEQNLADYMCVEAIH